MVDRGNEPLNEALSLVASGTPLREGLDRIVQAKRGALLVLGDNPAVLSVCTGGFLFDAEFSPQRVAELAKMDGAIILSADVTRIARANVHLVPDASIPTSETGTRHRTAERVARSIDVAVISISESMATIAVYRNDGKHTLQSTQWLLGRAGQALSTLQRFKRRFDLAVAALSTLEVEDTVTARDVVGVLQPGEMVHRIGEEIEGRLVELGDDGRLIRLQKAELTAGVEETQRLVVRDYLAALPPSDGDAAGSRAGHDGRDGNSEREKAETAAMLALHALTPDELLDPTRVLSTLGLGEGDVVLDGGLEARGYRLLHRLPRVSGSTIERIVEGFASLPEIMQASITDLEKVGGIGGTRARSVKDGLARLAEASILERYE